MPQILVGGRSSPMPREVHRDNREEIPVLEDPVGLVVGEPDGEVTLAW